MEQKDKIGNNLPQNFLIALREFKVEILESFRREFLKGSNDDEYLTRKDVARMLKVSVSTIDNWLRKGKLLKHIIEGKVYLKKSEVEKAISKV